MAAWQRFDDHPRSEHLQTDQTLLAFSAPSFCDTPRRKRGDDVFCGRDNVGWPLLERWLLLLLR
jgi:hypothetical protein